MFEDLLGFTLWDQILYVWADIVKYFLWQNIVEWLSAYNILWIWCWMCCACSLQGLVWLIVSHQLIHFCWCGQIPDDDDTPPQTIKNDDGIGKQYADFTDNSDVYSGLRVGSLAILACLQISRHLEDML